MYRFDWATPAFGGLLGACHGIEIPFVFDTLGVPSAGCSSATTRPPRAGRRRRPRAWVRFATTGDPGWPPYEVEHRLPCASTPPARSSTTPTRSSAAAGSGLAEAPEAGDEDSVSADGRLRADLFRLDGRRALVVGAGSGIGAASAAGLGRVRRRGRVRRHRRGRGRSRRRRASPAPPRSARHRRPGVDRRPPPPTSVHPTILVTTPSINVRKRIVDYTDDELDRVVDLNLKGTFRLCRTFGAAHGRRRARAA